MSDAVAGKGMRTESEEERRARKEKERAERKAKEKGEETEEERRARKEKERAERKAKEKGEETEEERRARKEKERAERKANEEAQRVVNQDTGLEQHSTKHGSGGGERTDSARPRSSHDELIAAIEEENRNAARSALQSREAEQRARRISQAAEKERESGENREQRRREKEKRRRDKGGEGSSAGRAAEAGASAVDVLSLQRQGYRAQFQRDLTRATAVRRLVDLDDAAAVLLDVAPQSEYDIYIRSFGANTRQQRGTQLPAEEEHVTVAVQAERVRQRSRIAQAPDDLGLCPELTAERQCLRLRGDGGDDVDDNEEEGSGAVIQRHGRLLAVDAGQLGGFLSRVFPVMNALLDESAGGATAEPSKTRGDTTFSALHTTFSFSGTCNRPVLKTAFSAANPQYLTALHGAATEAGPSPELDQYASVVVLWNTRDSSAPECALVSHSTITSLCLSPSRPHLIYGGTDDGCVCVWDIREPERQHLTAGRYQRVVCRLPSFSSSWQADNHQAAVRQVCIAGYNTSIGIRKDEHEQLVSLDALGHTKFWVVNDKEQSRAIISDTDYGLHMFSTVRLHLTTTKAMRSHKRTAEHSVGGYDNGANGGLASSSETASAAPEFMAASDLDFAPSDPSHFVIAMVDGIRHVNRFGSVAAPDVYAPGTHFFEPPVVVPSCVRYNCLDSRVLVAGYYDGTLRLYRHTESHPHLTVPLSASPIVEVRCSSSVKWMSFALDEGGTLHLLDHAHKDREAPLLSQPLTQPDTGLCLCMDTPAEEKADNRLLALGYEKGVVQLHVLDNEKLQTPLSDRNEQWL